MIWRGTRADTTHNRRGATVNPACTLLDTSGHRPARTHHLFPAVNTPLLLSTFPIHRHYYYYYNRSDDNTQYPTRCFNSYVIWWRCTDEMAFIKQGFLTLDSFWRHSQRYLRLSSNSLRFWLYLKRATPYPARCFIAIVLKSYWFTIHSDDIFAEISPFCYYADFDKGSLARYALYSYQLITDQYEERKKIYICRSM